MTSVTYAAAMIIQKTWRGYIFAKALPYALAQFVTQKEWERKLREIKIYGPEWGAPPTDSELEGSDDDDDDWRERQFECR